MMTDKTDFLLRIGEHIYQDFLQGFWTLDEANGALAILTDASDGSVWLAVPENWYVTSGASL